MKKRIIYLSLLLFCSVVQTTSAQDIHWSQIQGFEQIREGELFSPVLKNSSAYSSETVSMLRDRHWFELRNFKLVKKETTKPGVTPEIIPFPNGLPLNKNIGTKSAPEFFYFPASYQIGIYFVHKDQACATITPGFDQYNPLVTKKEGFGNEQVYINSAPFKYEAGLVLENKTSMDFEGSKGGYIPRLEPLNTTTTLIGFQNSESETAFKNEEIDFGPEEGIRLEREGNSVFYKYKDEVIFETELERIQDYRIVIAMYSPLSNIEKGTSVDFKSSSSLTVDQLFGLDPESGIIHEEYQWLVLGNEERRGIYQKEWEFFYHSFDYTYSEEHQITASSYCKCEDIGDKSENYNTACSYDIKGNLKSQSIGYYDDLGKGTQSQSLDMKTGKLWLNQTLYDSKGRAAFQSLSAPTSGNFRFLPNYDFIKNSLGSNFSSQDFEIGDPLEPNTVASTSNTLGWYYSDQNTEEPLQDITDRPYARSIYSDLFPGAVKQVVGGNKQNGEWRHGHAFSMPASQELSQTIAFGEVKYNSIKTIKTISRDVHGVENVMFTDTEGKTLASARSGSTTSRNMSVTVGKQGFIDVHVPQGTTGFTVTKPSNIQIEIYDLITENVTTSATSSLSNGFYRVSITNMASFDPTSTVVQVNYKENYYDYALNEYNKIGQLIASYQPIGTTKAAKPKSTFEYNGLGQLITSTSPDEGTAHFKYRRDRQIRFSQNSKQVLVNEFSYTNYDSKGRPIESGVAEGNFNTLDPNSITFAFSSKKEQHFTEYDYLQNPSELATLDSTYQNPTFLAGNVAKTYNTDASGQLISASYYSYDLYGRVKWMVQNINGLGFKTIDYQYDPLTSQVLKVIYQKHDADELFVHRYSYNAATSELEKVETSTNDADFITHAQYTYYETGAVKRVQLAGGIQNMDYVYNLAGQLKAINHPDLTASSDPGGDSTDLFGMTIDYFADDYKRNSNFSLSTDPNQQYNGNIKGITWKTNADFTVNPAGKMQYNYSYNRNNWLTEANLNSSLNPTDYNVYGITYDANGNIQTLNRNKNRESGDNEMDKFTYKYKLGKPNQLDHVDDAVIAPTGANDLKDQDPNNYTYNEIGQLVLNAEEGISYEYNASGLVTLIKKDGANLVAFSYNDKGFRVKKTSYGGTMPPVETYYIRDASGNSLAMYVGGQQKELPIYGASRIGVFNKQSNSSVYQLTDHLGNVRAVIAKDGAGNAAAMMATDYYPFGMPMPNRDIVGDYRYKFQGQEKDSETGKEAFQLRLWDGRIGRWLTTDPAGQYSTPYLGMGNNPINGIDPDGGKFFNRYKGVWNKKTLKYDIEYVDDLVGGNTFDVITYEGGPSTEMTKMLYEDKNGIVEIFYNPIIEVPESQRYGSSGGFVSYRAAPGEFKLKWMLASGAATPGHYEEFLPLPLFLKLGKYFKSPTKKFTAKLFAKVTQLNTKFKQKAGEKIVKHLFKGKDYSYTIVKNQIVKTSGRIKHIRYDLKGPGHNLIPTPHKQIYRIHLNPVNGKGRAKVEHKAATWWDLIKVSIHYSLKKGF